MDTRQLTDKEEIIARIATKLNETKVNCSQIVNVFRDSLLELIKESSEKGLRFDGLGTFYIKKRAAKKGRNPKTGQEIHIPEKKTIVFKASKTLKDEINQ
jgi:DNA-binding protein HU-beta